MTKSKFTFDTFFDEPPLYQIEKDLGTIKDLPDPVEWAIDNFKLTTAYAQPGDFVPYGYQRFPINAIKDFDGVIICGATQMCKSLIAEIQAGWIIDNLPMNALFVYAKKETVEDVFEDRIKPLIKEVPAINKYWSGNEKDLTRKKMRLRHMYIRVASSEVKADIATWSSGFVYMSEVSKYRKRRGWHPVEAGKRRQEAYIKLGRTKLIIESSPVFEGDCLDEEMKRPGVLNLLPHYPCPHCGKYQELVDHQIKELPNKKGEKDHNPERIRQENAAKYECVFCKKQIGDGDRPDMDQRCVYAAKTETISLDGTVHGRNKDLRFVSFQISRLCDFSFSFSECLARFMQSRRDGGESYSIYENEDMARFVSLEQKRVDEGFLKQREDRSYSQYKVGDIPNDVLVLVIGADTQDNGFYWIVRGYGKGMRSRLVRSGFVHAPIGDNEGGTIEPAQVAYNKFKSSVYDMPYQRKDGRLLDVTFGFIDMKGHRKSDVKYICDHMPEMHMYVGLSRVDPRRPLIEKSKNDSFYNGQSMLLSNRVGSWLGGKNHFLPRDIQQEYYDQVLNEWTEKKRDMYGNTKVTYVKMEPNHYRSCENYAEGAVNHIGLKDLLYDESSANELESRMLTQEPGKAPEVDELPEFANEGLSQRRSAWW